jgi:chromate transporter
MMELARLTWTFLWLSLLCVGGGIAALPEMERQAVKHHWVTAEEFVDGYTLSQVTPGPGMLVAIFIGYRAHGTLGGALAAAAIFLPPSALTLLVAHHWGRLRGRPWALTVERALAPIGMGLTAAGVYTLGRGAVHDVTTAAIAVIATVVLLRRWLPPVAVVLGTGAVSWLVFS